MNKLYSCFNLFTVLCLSLVFLMLFTCEDVDTTPPTVSLSSHYSGQIVGEIVIIKVSTDDNEGIKSVEFYINDSLAYNCTKSPFEYHWNTTITNDGEYVIKVISYDTSDNNTEAQPILLIVDNKSYSPNSVSVRSVTYDLSQMTVMWQKSNINDFKQYNLYYSDDYYSSNKLLINSYYSIEDTSYITTDFDPTIRNWYWVEIEDTLGLKSIGQPRSNNIELPPNSVTLLPIKYINDTFEINWSQNTNSDFKSYHLFESDSANLLNKNLIFETEDNNDTSYTVENVALDIKKYYQIAVTDAWELQSMSEIGIGSSLERILYLKSDAFYSIDTEGNNNTMLTKQFNDIWKNYFHISVDGKQIVFTEYEGGNYNFNIFVFEINSKYLNNLKISGKYPELSPDKTKLVYSKRSIETNYSYEIFIANPDGTDEKLLTSLGDCYFPTFTPDGSKIVFINRDELYVMEIDGTNQNILITSGVNNTKKPVIAPDGSKILIHNIIDNDLYAIDIDGNNTTQLTFSGDNYWEYNGLPSISLDGSQIVFISNRTGSCEIFIMDIGGGNQIKLSSLDFGLSSCSDFYPNFSSDGSKIGFFIINSDNRGLYVMHNDGSNITLVTQGNIANHKFIPR